MPDRPENDMRDRVRLALAIALPLAAFVIFPALFLDREAVLQTLPVRGALAGALAAMVAAGGAQKASALKCAGLGVASVLAGLPLMSPYAPPDPVSWVAALSVAALSAMLFAELLRRTSQRVAGALVLACLCLALLWESGAVPGIYAPWSTGLRQMMASEPVDEAYTGDAWIFLKTYWLVREGHPYYQSFSDAYLHDTRFGFRPRDRINFREPLTFELWRVLPGQPGVSIWYGHLAVSLLAMVAAYAVAVAFVEPPAALLASIVLAGYAAGHADFLQLTFQEFWAAPFGVLAVAFLVRKRWWPSAVALVLAVAVRETMLYLVPVYALGWAGSADRRRDALALLGATVVPVAIVGVHLAIAPAIGGSRGVATWLHGGADALFRAVGYSTVMVPYGAFVSVAAVCAALVGAVLQPDRSLRAPLVAAVVLPMLVLFGFSTGEGAQYWGGMVMPLVYALAPLVLVRLMPARVQADDASAETPEGCAA